MAGYLRKSVITNGNVIDAGLFNDEFNLLSRSYYLVTYLEQNFPHPPFKLF